MAITDPESVLVLGAGVSKPFGLPLGGEVISTLSSAIKTEIDNIYDERDFDSRNLKAQLRSASRNIGSFGKFPIHGTMAISHWNTSANEFDIEKLNNDLRNARSLVELLDGQTSETIDDFIVENPTYAFLTKIGIASLFLNTCFEFAGNEMRVRAFSARHYPADDSPTHKNRNWAHLLINIIRHGIRSGTVTPDNKIKIITFNYDKVLEFVLEQQFSNTEAVYDHYTDYIDILHVHGECGDLGNPRSGAPAENCLAWAGGIHVVNEGNVPEHIEGVRRAAKKIIQSATELYFCGFSFSGPNCRLLGLNEPNSNLDERLISYCNYDGNVGISKKVEEYELLQHPLKSSAIGAIPSKRGQVLTKIEVAAGTIDKPIGVSDWLKLGYLGELPG